MVNYYEYYIVQNEHLYGPGRRLLLFLQGCTLHCKGCINKHLWDFGKGTNISAKEVLGICLGNNLEGITLHGGEPLDQDEGLIDIIRLLKDNKLTVILFTGYIKKELDKNQIKVWNLADLVVCGRFIESKKNLFLQFRGSTNQRVIRHKGPYKNYKLIDGETVAIFTFDDEGNSNIKGFYSNEIDELKEIIKINK